MGIFSSLLGDNAPQTLASLESKVASLIAAGDNAKAVRATEKFREAAERDRRIDEDQRLLQVGSACAISLGALHGLANTHAEGAREKPLFAFFASYRAVHEAFSRLDYGKGKIFRDELERFLALANQKYENVYEQYENEDLSEIDNRANDYFSARPRL